MGLSKTIQCEQRTRSPAITSRVYSHIYNVKSLESLQHPSLGILAFKSTYILAISRSLLVLKYVIGSIESLLVSLCMLEGHN